MVAVSAMDIGVALPQMTTGLDRASVEAWCAGIDAGPFSSVSAGERITFHNLEGLTLCAAAAVLTRRVRVMVNVAVLPWHAPAMIAKQLATIDVLSGGRVEVAVGVGGREQDFNALGSPVAGRHQRLDDAVAEVRRLWAGGHAADGSAVGPSPARSGGLPLFASAMGPKGLARAATWADGISGFSLLGDAAETDRLFRASERAWRDAGRSEPPRLLTGSFVCLGADAESTLRTFAYDYLEVFSPELARSIAGALTMHTPERLSAALDDMAEVGCDEFIVVPATADPAMLDELTDVVASR
jgi:alkanesulfonate monooxygenase SsuD/methylene tetrahydromethanopterin reductase-like flavin-dependent oxidoreductase (luciferase family)